MEQTKARWSYTKGLHDLGEGCYAWLQPDGSWGWSNAGLVVDGDRSLLVDTLFDLKLTREMLDGMRRAEPKAMARVGALVNTHSNPDHTNGNQLVETEQIIASRNAAEDMPEEGPQRLAELMRRAPEMGATGRFIARIFEPFDFEGITQVLPTRTFEGELRLAVGDKAVHLIQVGPAHTRGDVICYVPENKTVFTGDILFVGGHPIMWAGPMRNWIGACQRILDLDVEVVVPGHGPVVGKPAVVEVKGYLEYIEREARKRYDAGVPAVEAARDIRLDDYASWTEGERIVVTVINLYREFAGEDSPRDVLGMMGEMAALARA